MYPASMSHVSPKQVFPLAKNWSNIYKRLTQEPNYRWQHNHPHQKTQEEGRQRRTLIKKQDVDEWSTNNY